jgi:hypothetical protein
MRREAVGAPAPSALLWPVQDRKRAWAPLRRGGAAPVYGARSRLAVPSAKPESVSERKPGICIDRHEADRIPNVTFIDAKHRDARYLQAKLLCAGVLSERIRYHKLGYPGRVAPEISSARWRQGAKCGHDDCAKFQSTHDGCFPSSLADQIDLLFDDGLSSSREQHQHSKNVGAAGVRPA